jgi:hypothetical protein
MVSTCLAWALGSGRYLHGLPRATSDIMYVGGGANPAIRSKSQTKAWPLKFSGHYWKEQEAEKQGSVGKQQLHKWGNAHAVLMND